MSGNLYYIISIGKEVALNFLLAFFVGSLVYYLTLTTLSTLFSVVFQSRSLTLTQESQISRFIFLLSLSAALFVSFWLHYFWDWLSVWYTTPAGPSLLIVK